MLQAEIVMADSNPSPQQLWDWVPASLHPQWGRETWP